MYEIRYCLVCASELTESLLPTEDRPRLHCANCGYVHYLNPKVVCGALPVEEGKAWLLRRGIEPRYGYWTYPAGFLEMDETTEEGATRESREEIGCDVEITGLLGIYSRAGAPVNIVYLARFLSDRGRPCITGEAIEVRPFGPHEIPWDDLAFTSTHAALADWVRRET